LHKHHVEVGVELDDDARKVLHRRGGHFFDPGNALQLFLDGLGDELLHVGRRSAGIDRGDENGGHHHVRELLFGQRIVRHDAGERDEHRDDKNARPVIDRPGGWFEFFHFIAYKFVLDRLLDFQYILLGSEAKAKD
jgi:hypothetical protein